MPVPALVQATDAVGRPDHHVRHAGTHVLRPDEPLAAGVLLAPLDPAEGATVVQRRVVTATAVGTGHTPIVPNAGSGRHGAPTSCRSGTA